MADEITITIDGQEVKTTSDKMLIQAANDAGVYVPYLCYHPGMKPYGACRMCVVEVEGAPGTPASCTLPVRDGMVVNTKGENAVAVRETTMDMLLAEHPHGCLTCHRIDLCGPQDVCLRHVSVLDRCVMCPKNERCELKDTTRYHTMPMNSSLTYQYRGLQVETNDPFYDRDYNLCIVCARCVRACDEVRGDVALTMTERAGQVLVGTSMGESLLESGCEFCGACLDVCPVGALTESNYKWERASRVEKSVCNQCSVGCQMTYEVNNRERVVRAIPELNAPANHGQACFKGKFGFDFVNSKERLKTPMVRREGVLEEASWDEALDFVAERLPQYKGEVFALVADARGTNEELYLAQKFSRAVMQSNNVDVASNQRPGVMEGLADVFGYYAGTGSIDDLRHAACVLMVSANLTEDNNVVALPIKQRVRAGTQKLIVIDTREVEMTRYAHLWLRPYPGADSAVLGGMLRVIMDEGLADSEFLIQRCEGLDGLRESLTDFSLEAVEKESGVPAEKIREAARLFAQSVPASIVYALDNTVGGTRRIASRAIADLALVTANVGKPGAAVLPMRLGTNEQGAWDMGCAWRMLPGSVPITDSDALERVSGAWGVSLPVEQALGVRDVAPAARDGRLKAAVVIGDHATFHDGTLDDVPGALEGLEFLLAVDTFMSPIAERADVVLPASAFLETKGTYTNLERRIQPLKQVFKLKTVDARPSSEIISDLARRMGAQGFDFDGPEQVLDEIAKVVPHYAGVSYQRLLDEAVTTIRPSTDNPLPTQVQYSDKVSMGIQWPCTSAAHAGTPVLYEESFLHGKAHVAALTWREQPQHEDTEFPLLLAHGRVLVQPEQAMDVVQVERAPKRHPVVALPMAVGAGAGQPQEAPLATGHGLRNRIEREEHLVLTAADAQKAGVSDGQHVKAVTRTGKEIAAVVQVSPEGLRGVVSVTTLFGELASEMDASVHPDAMNHVPRLEVEPVRLEPV